MSIAPEMVVVPIVAASIFFGASALMCHAMRASHTPMAISAAASQDKYRVSWSVLWVGYCQFVLAALPALVVAMSPNPGTAGYLVFGGASILWASFAIWNLRKLKRTFVLFEPSQVVYYDGRLFRVLPYDNIKTVTTASGYIVCLQVSERRRFLIPLQFSGNAMILARLRSVSGQATH